MRARIFVVAVAMTAASACRADVIFDFVPTSLSAPAGAPYRTTSVEGRLALNDAAAAAGGFVLADVTRFAFAVNDGYRFTLTPAPGPVPPYAGAAIRADGLGPGAIGQGTWLDGLALSGGDDGVWTGRYLTDNEAVGCFITAAPCGFTGVWRREADPTAVAEPGGAPLFGAAAGVLLLAWRRARR